MEPETPRLSPSIAHKLISEGPLSAYANHRLLGNLRKPPTESQIKGRLYHAAILGTESEVGVVDADDFRTKVAKQERDRILMEGRIPVVASKWQGIVSVAKIIRDKIAEDLGLVPGLKASTAERRIEWEEDGVLCSGSIDLVLTGDRLRIIELKTGEGFPTEQLAMRTLGGSHALYQEIAYRNGLADAMDGAIDAIDIDVIFCFVQTEPPFGVYSCRMAGDFRQIAYLRWERAKKLWAEMLETDGWHNPRGVQLLSAPGWMLNQELLEEAMQDE